MLKKFLVFIVTMFNCINPSSTEYNAAAELIHCQQKSNPACKFMIFRQQEEDPQISGYAQAPDCAPSITAEDLVRLRTELLAFVKPITEQKLDKPPTKPKSDEPITKPKSDEPITKPKSDEPITEEELKDLRTELEKMDFRLTL